MENAQFTGEKERFGKYGDILCMSCKDKLGDITNGGYNNFLPSGCKKLIVKALPESIDVAGVYTDRKDTGWVSVQYADRKEQTFVQFTKRPDGLFEALVII